ncbi:MAG: TonB-dependent receptor [Pyrinomonadaceae bacterium]|nr:TonB-dependent receptor [Pyrinomonadaceae bacterium]
MLKQIRFISVALSLMLCFTAIAFGQGQTGAVDGSVVDQTDAVVPGAVVTIESTGSTTGYRRTITADANGRFIFSGVRPGTYKVSVEMANFAPYSRNVSVVVDKTVSVRATLEPAGTVTEVNVTTDSAVTVDLGDTKIDTNITKEVIDALPKGTNFTTLLKIAPNVRPEAAGGGFQIDGASGSENVFVIDGQEVTNFATGTLNSSNNIPFELLQEVQVKSTGFEAEYGGATGGVINAVTAGGNNEWRGTFGASFRVAKFQGSFNEFINRYGTGTGEFEYFQPRKDGGTDFFPVANLSGPIIKDRVWGSFTYAPQIFETSRTVDSYSQPSPGRTITQTNTYDATRTNEYVFGRVDAQPFDQLRVYGTWLWNPRHDDGELPGTGSGLTSAAPILSQATYAARGGRQNGTNWNTQATWTPLNWFLLNFRTGRSFLNEKLASYGRQAAQRFAVSTGSPLNPCANPGAADYIRIDNPGDVFCRGFNTGSNSLTFLDVSTRTTYDVDASFVGINAGGRHNIKVGYQRNELYNDVNSGYTTSGYLLMYYGRPVTVYTGSAVTPLPNCDPVTYNPADNACSLGTARMVRIGTLGEASSDNIAIYGQDSYQINDRVTLNFGLRLENEIVPSFGDPATTTDITFGWGDKVAPRFGAAVDLTGDGKTKLFGSYGWFYDRFKYELPRGLFGAETFLDDFAEIVPSRGVSPYNYTFANHLGGRMDLPGGTCPIVGGPGYSLCSLDRRVPSNAIGANPFAGAGAVDPDLKAMRQSEYTFGLERELGNNFVMAARYTHKQLDNAIEDIGAFNAQGSEAYVIGNPGKGLACEISQSSNLPCTEAERKYDAVEVRLDKRASKYFYNASYTWSRLFGNYSGLASSDEFGRNSPNVNRFFDLPMLGWNANGEPDNGLLSTDRPHVFKAYGGYTHDWAGDGVNTTSFSGFTTIQSGTPITTQYDLFGVTTSVLNGRGDAGRTGAFYESDLGVTHRYRFGRDNKFSMESYVEIRNIFDNRSPIRHQQAISSSNITDTQLTAGGCTTCTDSITSFNTLFNGGGLRQYIDAYWAANPSLLRNDYNQVISFQGGRDVRFGFRFKF